MLRKLQNLKKKESGFTIVEVMIVLAIAGLIILIVLLAVPALQRNSRNNGVRNDAARMGGLIQELVNNNGGQLPRSGTTGTPPITGVNAPTPPNSMLPANADYSRLGAVDYNVHLTALQGVTGQLARDTAYIRNFSVCTNGSGGETGNSSTGATIRSVTVTYLVESPGAAATAGNWGNPADFVAQCQSVN